MIPTKGCSFQIACRHALGITDSVVIAHSVAGCAHGAARMFMQSRTEDARLISTGIYEEDLIHGGESKLRAALNYALEQYHPSVVIVVAGCTPQIMSDDITGIISKVQSNISILSISAAGFDKKSTAAQPAKVLQAAASCMTQGKIIQNSVNLIGLFPDDYRMDSDLPVIRALLGPEVSVNAIYAFDSFEHICQIPNGALNVVWRGCEEDGVLLQSLFHTPYVVSDYPYGVEGTSRFLRTVFSCLGLSAEEKIRGLEETVYARLAPFHSHVSQLLGAPCAVIGTQTSGGSLTTMLREELGMCVKLFDTERYPDFSEIERQLAASPIAMLFGDSFAQGMARRLGIPLFRCCYPVTDRVTFGRKPYAGYTGFLNLLEDIINLAMEHDREEN